MISLLDTSTRPSRAMLRAMATAAVGDDSRGEDPSVNHLCDRVAELVGCATALFLPSGTMANLISLLVHCRPGQAAIAEAGSHVIWAEGGGAAAIAGVSIVPVAGHRGIYSAAALESAAFVYGSGTPNPACAIVEQTSNFGGGTIWSLDALQSVGLAARRLGMKMHMDGARLLHASVATGLPARQFAVGMDSVFIDLSKGLGCPAGAVLAGSDDFIASARSWRQMLGGAMRQAGVLAAAGGHALTFHVDRLSEDHRRAKMLAGLLCAEGVAVRDDPPETNIVLLDLSGQPFRAPSLARALDRKRIRISAPTPDVARLVTHMDLGDDEVRIVARAIAKAWSALRCCPEGG